MRIQASVAEDFDRYLIQSHTSAHQSDQLQFHDAAEFDNPVRFAVDQYAEFHHDAFFFPSHRARLAFLALSERSAAVWFLTRCFPPRFPSSTAAGFFFLDAIYCSESVRMPNNREYVTKVEKITSGRKGEDSTFFCCGTRPMRILGRCRFHLKHAKRFGILEEYRKGAQTQMANNFNSDITSSEFYWQNDAAAREMAGNAWDELQMMDFDMDGAEPELERARRRSPIEEKCCDNPAGFTCVPSLERDPHTGYLEGSYYRCVTCGTRICEEDYAALVEYTDRRLKLEELMEREPVPAEFEIPVSPRRVA